MHKANYESSQVITVFAGATHARGIAVVIDGAGRTALPTAGAVPNVITMAVAERVGEPIQGAIPNGGVVLIRAGAALPIGDVSIDATGRAVPSTVGAAIIGTALTAADAVDELIAIQFTSRGVSA